MFQEEYAQRCAREVAKFKESLLRSLLPNPMNDEDAVEFLNFNGVRFVQLPDGRRELHGFGRKLGDVFYGVDEESPSSGIHFVTRFTPVDRFRRSPQPQP